MAGLGVQEVRDLEEQGKALGLGPACLKAYLAVAAHGSTGAAARADGKDVRNYKDHLQTAVRRGMPDPRPSDMKFRGQAKPGAVTAKGILGLVEAQGFRCALSGRDLRPETASLDHRLPVSRGGEHLLHNAQVVHEQVQRAKGNMTDEEFIALCKDVVTHARKGAQPKQADEGMFTEVA